MMVACNGHGVMETLLTYQTLKTHLPVKQILSNWSCGALGGGITSKVLELFVDAL